MCNCGKNRRLAVLQPQPQGIRTAPTPVPIPTPRPRFTPAPAPAPAPMRRIQQIRSAPVSPAPSAPLARRIPSYHIGIPRVRPPPLPVTALRTVDPAIWGPPLWRLLHSIAEVAETDTEWVNLLTTLRTCLPCPDCAHHYNAWVDGHAVDGVSIKSWLLDLHNDVNRRKGVPQWTPEMVSASVNTVRRERLLPLLARIRGKVGEAACQILAGMLRRLR